MVGVVEVRPPENLAPAVLMHNDGHDRIASMLYWRGVRGWEPATIRTFLRLLSPGSAVLDVGANSGLFALLAARRDPSVRVHAIEPVRRVFSLLQANVALNALENVTCYLLACSDREGAAVVQVPAGEPVPVMASLLSGWCEGPSTDEPVDVVTVDGMVATYGIERPEVIKIDAEGSEDAVLRGARVTLDLHRPFVLAEVLRRGRLGEAVAAVLDDCGYRPFQLGMRGPRPLSGPLGGIDDDENHNYLFVHHSRIEEARRLLA
ncbi:MAG: FkbM family methyltransferase [Actinomycetota bacterium]|nr:FkbM family methyltransferase [Actinomycetota bacterium]